MEQAPTLMQLIYYFYLDNVFNVGSEGIFDVYFTFQGTEFGYDFPQYLAITCTYITLIVIVILCFLFVYKIIRLIGGLIK